MLLWVVAGLVLLYPHKQLIRINDRGSIFAPRGKLFSQNEYPRPVAAALRGQIFTANIWTTSMNKTQDVQTHSMGQLDMTHHCVNSHLDSNNNAVSVMRTLEEHLG